VADIFIVLLSVDVHLCSTCFYWLSMGSGELKHDLANGTAWWYSRFFCTLYTSHGWLNTIVLFVVPMHLRLL
jgi:hypothetical protein